MRKFGILTWHYYANFGSALQAYALQSAVESLGFEAKIINYQNPRFHVDPRKEQLCSVIGSVFRHIPLAAAQRFAYPFQVFRAKYLHQTARVTDGNAIPELLSGFDGVICGSDQIWAPNVFNPVYFLENISRNQLRKVSYAASIGLNEIPAELQQRYRELLREFNAVSVREKRGKELLKQVCNVDATVVLDPTLLLDAEHYRGISSPVCGIPPKFIFCYFLKKDHQYRARVEAYARTRGLRVIGVSENAQDGQWMQLLQHMGPREFLWLIDNSQAVFTDSYHGTIFSMLLHKDFYTFERFSSKDPICQNSRIYQLDDWFGIGERILGVDDVPEKCTQLDYEAVDGRLREARAFSFSYLSEALK